MRDPAGERLRAGGRRHARPHGQSQIRPEARLHRTDDALVGRVERADDHRRRLQRRTVGMRRLEPQGLADRRQPHSGRGRGPEPPPASARLDRHRAAVRPGARALLHLVELSVPGLDQERSRASARPHVGVARACWASLGAHRAGIMPQLGATLGPRAADLRDRRLTAAPPIRRAIAALRAGRIVRIEGRTPTGIVAVETATPELLDLVDPNREAKLLISGQRAAALALANLRDAADPAQPVLIERSDWMDVDSAIALADPGRDLDRGPIGPLKSVPCSTVENCRAALELARSAGLLPALWVVGAEAAVRVSADEVLSESQLPHVEVVARAMLPLEGMPD